MTVQARGVNARLLAVYPEGFALDADHQPHVTILQRFVRAADLKDLYAAANNVFASEDPTAWTLTASKAYYIPSPPIGLAGIVVEPTDDLLRLQQKLIDAITPYTVPTGTVDAFASTQQGRDIQEFLVQYVATFVPAASGENLNPHVTTGAGPQTYLDEMMAEPFEAFAFSPVGASVYQLGAFGTAQKKLSGADLETLRVHVAAEQSEMFFSNSVPSSDQDLLRRAGCTGQDAAERVGHASTGGACPVQPC